MPPPYPIAPHLVALVRHPPAAIAPGLCYGRLDLDLAPGSEAAIGAIVTALAAFPAATLWSSPASRCRAVACALPGTPIVDPRLLELDFGDWEGRAWSAVPRASLDRWAASPADFAPPGGESGAALIARITSFHADLIAADTPAIVISHGGPLRLLTALLRGTLPDLLAPSPPLGSVTIITPPPSG